MVDDSVKTKVISEAKKEGVKFIRLQFTDILGTPKNCAVTIDRLEEVLDEGLWFDGSSIEGFVRIHESDMIAMPDSSTFRILPWTVKDKKVARVICDIEDTKGKPFKGDPRYALKKMLKEATDMGYNYYIGPEAEFFLFKTENGFTTTPEPQDKAGYFDLDNVDLGTDIRKETMMVLEEMGIKSECSHHEVAVGQHEIDFVYQEALSMADTLVTYKYVLKKIASKYGMYASFMPKPIQGINGSGMHTHQSLWRREENAFYDENGEYNLSDIARYFVGGQLKHCRNFTAITNSLVNSYKRLIPGYEAPVYISWGRRNRSALIRVPSIRKGKKSSARIELRSPDPACNPYLAFAVMLKAGLDGIKKKIEPPDPVEEDVYHFDDRKLAKFYIKTLPNSLFDALLELDKDDVIKEALGSYICEKFTEAKRAEWESYRQSVSRWELDTYLPII
ncbi:MAG: type I glutamate--ammonia ligase [Candidatus Methanofastidiosia archaeon]